MSPSRTRGKRIQTVFVSLFTLAVAVIPTVVQASVLLNAQGNQLDAYDLSALIPATTRTTPIPSHEHQQGADPGTDTQNVNNGNDVNGQICRIVQANGDVRYVMGEDSDQGSLPRGSAQGWGLFEVTSPEWTLRDKLVPLYNFTDPPNTHLPDNTGCAVTADGTKLYTVDLGIGAFDAARVGSLFVFYRDANGNFSSSSTFCILDDNLSTAGYIAIDDDGSVLVPESGRSAGGVISRFAPPFPATGSSTGTGGACAGYDLATKKSDFISDVFAFTPISIVRRDGLLGGKWLVGSPVPGMVHEYDANGNFVRPITVLQGPGVAGMAVDPATNDLYIANLGLIPDPEALFTTGPMTGSLWRLPFDPVTDTPLAPILIQPLLEFPEGMGIFPAVP